MISKFHVDWKADGVVGLVWHTEPNGFLHSVSGSICTALTDFGSGLDFLCSRFFCFIFLFVFVFCGCVARLTTLSVFQCALNFLHHRITSHHITSHHITSHHITSHCTKS